MYVEALAQQAERNSESRQEGRRHLGSCIRRTEGGSRQADGMASSGFRRSSFGNAVPAAVGTAELDVLFFLLGNIPPRRFFFQAVWCANVRSFGNALLTACLLACSLARSSLLLLMMPLLLGARY